MTVTTFKYQYLDIIRNRTNEPPWCLALAIYTGTELSQHTPTT